MNIKDITADYIPEVAGIHLKAFSKDHLTSRFSREMLERYFSVLIKHEKYNLLALDDENQVIGYLIAGSKFNNAFNEYMKEDFFAIIKVLLRSNPSFILEKIKNKLMKITGKIPPAYDEISVNIIAVDPETQSKGIGSALLSYLETELLKDGISDYTLYVREGNKDALDFYLRKNFLVDNKFYNSMKLKKVIKPAPPGQ